MSIQYFHAYIAVMKKLRKLESYKDYITVKNGITNNDLFDAQHDLLSLPKIRKMKNLQIIYDVAKEWYLFRRENLLITLVS